MQIETIELVGGTKARAKDVNDNITILKNAIYALEESIEAQNAVLTDLQRRPTRHMFDIYFSLENQAPTGAYPLWKGDWITHCDTIYPEFWEALTKRAEAETIPTCSAADYEKALSTYGQCGKFVVDTLNGKVRLPKITRFISSVSDISSIGSVENDAIRNITGSLEGGNNTTYFSASSGAFYRSSDGYADSAGSSGRSGRPRTAYFDASRVVPTADENRPKNVRMGLYIQISNNTADVSQLDTQVIANELAAATEELTALKEELAAALSALGAGQVSAIETAAAAAEENVRTTATLVIQDVEAAKEEALTEIAAQKDDIISAGDDALAAIEAAEGDITTARDEALSAIEAAEGDITTARDEALSAIEAAEGDITTARDDALSAIEAAEGDIATARDAALSTLDTAKDEAVTAVSALVADAESAAAAAESAANQAAASVQSAADIAAETATEVAGALVAGKMDQVVSHDITLTAAGWDSVSFTQTVTVSGMTADKIVWVAPRVSSDNLNEQAYASAGVWCRGQGADTLTFGCQSTPTADIYVTIVF